jgi:hypothetical protein
MQRTDSTLKRDAVEVSGATRGTNARVCQDDLGSGRRILVLHRAACAAPSGIGPSAAAETDTFAMLSSWEGLRGGWHRVTF